MTDRHRDPALTIHEALSIVRDAVADLEAARAEDAAIIAVLRAEVAALREDLREAYDAHRASALDDAERAYDAWNNARQAEHERALDDMEAARDAAWTEDGNLR